MLKLFYLMNEHLVEKFAQTKSDIISAREKMNASEVESAKSEIIKECKIYSLDDNSKDDQLYSVENGVAIIPVMGMLVDEVDICSAFFGETITTYGYIRESIARAEKDFQVKSILLNVNSGGGYVFECEETFQTILNSKKPVFAMTHDHSCSAAYWLSSAADEIISVSKTGFIGSIGVAAEIVNRDKEDETKGIKRITLTNTSSKDKRPNYMTEEGRQILIDEFDALYNVFVNSILEKRKKMKKEKIDSLNGKVLISDDAISYGLIDKYMQESKVIDYINEKQNKQSNKLQAQAVIIKPTPVKGKMEGTMNLKEFLASNPEAQAEYIAALKSEYNKGVADVNSRIAKVSPILASEHYDSALKAQAQKALKGEISLEAFESVVAIEDMRIQREKSDLAKDETAKTGDTQAEAVQLKNDGIIRNAEDAKEAAKAAKGGK
jgi:signal peptide peptidase SppA